MLSFVLALLFAFLLGLAAASVMLVRPRVGGGRRSPPVVDDEVVRAILERGVVTTDEDDPLDLSEIDEEERRFWSETWDDPEEW